MNKANIYALRMSLIVFPIVAAIFLVPYLVYQYRKHGSVVFFKAFVTYAFIYYLLTAFLLVMLPLHSRSFVAKMTTPYYDLEAFGFIKRWIGLGLFDIQSKAHLLSIISSPLFLEPFFNMLLTIPFGVFLRYFFKRDWWEVILYSFFLSMFFELSQLSGLYGFYSRPHRLFQIDDLILNTLGGTIGYIITPLVVFMFPSRDRLDEVSRDRSDFVGPIRRLLALTIDTSLIVLFGILLFSYIFKDVSIITIAKNWPKYIKILLVNDLVYIAFTIFLIVFFMLIPLILDGSTIGKKIVRIKMVNDDDSKLSFARLLGSNIFIFIIGNFYYFSALIYFNKLGNLNVAVYAKSYNEIIIFVVTLILFVGNMYNYIVHNRLLQEIVSKTKHVTI